jgi:hypothetical protein
MSMVYGSETEKNLKNKIFTGLDLILSTSMQKFKNPNLRDSQKMSWARLFILGARAYGDIYELALLEERIEVLEGKIDVQTT